MKYRDFYKLNRANDGERSLFESVVAPEVEKTLRDWTGGGVLIGGLALSYHIRPRMTQDVDILFLSDAAIPAQVEGFKRNRNHAFQHSLTHVEVEAVTPEHVDMPPEIARAVVATAIQSNDMLVASAAGLVALKSFRLSRQDQADIIALVKTCDLSLEDLGDFPLPAIQKEAVERLIEEAADDPHPV